MPVSEDAKILPPGWSPQPKAPFQVNEWVDFTEYFENEDPKFRFHHGAARIIKVDGLVVVAQINDNPRGLMTFAPRLSDGTYVRVTHPSEVMSIPDFVPDDDEFPTKIYRGRYTKHVAEMKEKAEADAKAEAERQANKSKLRRIVESLWRMIWAP
jgi:hypothetical protein